MVSAAPSSLPFLFSSYLTLVLSSPPYPLLHLSFCLKLCGRSGRNCLISPPVLSGYNGPLDTRFSQGTTRLMSWPDGERYLCPLQSLVVSLFLSLVSTLLFFRTGGELSHLNFWTHNFHRFSPRNLCSLVTLLLLLFTRPLPGDGGMAEDHGAPEAGQLPRVWTRGRKETESRQRVSGAKSP